MKVLFWCPFLSLGGGERLLAQLVLAMARHPEVERLHFVAPGEFLASGRLDGADAPALNCTSQDEPPAAAALRQRLSSDTRVLGLPGSGHVKRKALKLLDARQDRRLQSLLRDAARDADIVYVFWTLRQKFRELGKPLVCTVHDVTLCAMPEILGGDDTRREYELTRRWLCDSTQVVVSSQATADTIRRLFGLEVRAEVVHHAILPDAQDASKPRPSPLRASLPKRYIVCPSGIASHKNHETLFKAWARFPRRHEIGLVLFGMHTEHLNLRPPEWHSYWGYARINGVIARLGLCPGEDFHSLGYLEDEHVLGLIAEAEALICPSLSEGGGSYPVEEALRLGTPVLCSDIPVLREHLHGRTAKIGWFDPDSPEAIVRAMDHLLDNYAEYKDFTERGRADPRPTWDDVANGYVQVFQRVLAREGQERGAAT